MAFYTRQPTALNTKLADMMNPPRLWSEKRWGLLAGYFLAAFDRYMHKHYKGAVTFRRLAGEDREPPLTLLIRAKNHQWKHELHAQRYQIMQELNQKMSGQYLQKIRLL